MYDLIKKLADNAVAIQNKVGMEETLKAISDLCAQELAAEKPEPKAKHPAKKEGND